MAALLMAALIKSIIVNVPEHNFCAKVTKLRSSQGYTLWKYSEIQTYLRNCNGGLNTWSVQNEVGGPILDTILFYVLLVWYRC